MRGHWFENGQMPPQKRVLRQQTEDKNQKCVVYKAYCSIKSYPLEVCTITDLKHIHGIGETLAVRCHSAWEAACASYPSGLDLNTVKNLSDEDFVGFVNMTSSRRARADQRSNVAVEASSKSSQKRLGRDKNVLPNSCIPEGVSGEQTESSHALTSQVGNHGSQEVRNESEPTTVCPADSASLETITYVSCQPSDQAEVILIADLRENNAKFRGNTVVECMAKSEHRMDMRPLSVGDYLWVARKIDGTEVILDWIVERKTWSDLHQSIRSGRYEEQKQRLRRSPMKNRVYLVEGTLSPQYSACEQALATTMVIDGFMIQRTRSPHDSAQFLMRLTEYLKRMVTSRQVSGITFECFQGMSKKARAESVKDVWTRQLMVCPGMSSDRAQKVANRFPSMMSMMQLYSSSKMDHAHSVLSSAVPGINQALSTQMSKFFSHALKQ
ncbi:ERCC4 domain-containing protein [Trichostrongylus colubriformis]|uniref:Crossover junction endonuclease MUS81 n=1 Tax=Trichostrongylus colubriformis TaxID=6319 RepID=A0AAN8F9G3_TRICO